MDAGLVAVPAEGRTDETPSMVVIDTHLARCPSNGGLTFHDRAVHGPGAVPLRFRARHC